MRTIQEYWCYIRTWWAHFVGFVWGIMPSGMDFLIYLALDEEILKEDEDILVRASREIGKLLPRDFVKKVSEIDPRQQQKKED